MQRDEVSSLRAEELPLSCWRRDGAFEVGWWMDGWKRDDAAGAQVACLQLAGNGNRRYAALDGGYAPAGCHPFSLRPLFFCGLAGSSGHAAVPVVYGCSGPICGPLRSPGEAARTDLGQCGGATS